MKMQKSCHDLALKNLQQYPLLKRLIAEYEEVSLGARKNDTPVMNSGVSDPTARRAIRLAEPDAAMKAVYDWVWAIESAYEMIKEASREQALLMEHLFGLNGREVRYSTRLKRDELVSMLHISEPTLYRWKEEIISAVMFGALQTGVISAYARRKKVEEGA